MNLVIFGPPGAGKGTQSNFIAKKFNLFQLSTGALLRREIENKTKLGGEILLIIYTSIVHGAPTNPIISLLSIKGSLEVLEIAL